MMKKYIIRIEWILFISVALTIWATLNYMGITDTDSDLFWALFGAGAAIECCIILWTELKEDDNDE